MTKKLHFRSFLLTITLIATILSCTQDHKIAEPVNLVADEVPFATDLKAPIGLADDPSGNIWVTEAGSGEGNDGQVTVITPSGEKYPVITGFLSAMSPEGSPEGLNHLLYHEGKLYILHGVHDNLYIVDVSTFVPGVTAPINASSLTSEDIGTYVRNEHPNAPDAKDSNPYNLTFGPDGDLFIVDAGANAVIRRNKSSKALSIYAVIPDVANPTDPLMGPPTIDAVPTGIVYDGTNLFISTLAGFPFPEKLAKIYQINTTGGSTEPTEYKTGFSGITDLALFPGGKLMVTEFGFTPAGGRVANGQDAAQTLLAPAITPVDIMLSTTSSDTYYLLQYGPGIIVKLSAR
jgi:hypothetical protein